MTPHEKLAQSPKPVEPDAPLPKQQVTGAPMSTALAMLKQTADGSMNAEEQRVFDAAITHHNRNVDLLHGVLQSGAQDTSNAAWSKICGLLLQGYVDVYVLSPTPAPELLAAKLEQPGKLAYFGLTKKIPQRYVREDLRNNPGLKLMDPANAESVGQPRGFRDAKTGAIAIVDPVSYSDPKSSIKLAIEQLLPELASTSEAPSTTNYTITG